MMLYDTANSSDYDKPLLNIYMEDMFPTVAAKWMPKKRWA
jgi:hypothetical protein